MKEAIKDSGLEESEVSDFKTRIVMGSGGPSIENVIVAADKTRAKTPKLKLIPVQRSIICTRCCSIQHECSMFKFLYMYKIISFLVNSSVMNFRRLL